jgi:hypothetical protein
MTGSHLSDEKQRDINDEFHHVVNMTSTALRRWLQTPASQSVGMTPEGTKVTGPDANEAVGHEMGRRIVSLLATPRTKLSGDDYKMMQKVIGYIHRHLKQCPSGDVADTRWAKSLKNWGHDPSRKDE